MKPKRFSPAHKNPNLAELVCSNSLRFASIDSAVGLLKEEMRLAGSLIMDVAHKTQVPAGKAMANSVNHVVVFRQSRYGSIDEGDYLNCPMDKDTESEGHLMFPLYKLFGIFLIRASC